MELSSHPVGDWAVYCRFLTVSYSMKFKKRKIIPLNLFSIPRQKNNLSIAGKLGYHEHEWQRFLNRNGNASHFIKLLKDGR